MKTAAVLCLLGAIVFLAGCGGAVDQPAVAPVEGTVTYNGEPLEQGTITFYPSQGRSASGRIVNGRIVEVTTSSPGDGAPIGMNRITVQSFAPAAEGEEEDEYAAPQWLIPQRYGKVDDSKLTADIQAGQTNQVTLELTD